MMVITVTRMMVATAMTGAVTKVNKNNLSNDLLHKSKGNNNLSSKFIFSLFFFL
jgi:hypothetical protein